MELSGLRLWLRRFGWLLLIWCASVATLAVVATLLKLAVRSWS